MSFLRDESVESATTTYEMALPFKHMIIGIGLDSNEIDHPPMPFDKLYREAKAAGFHLTAHCDVNVPDTHSDIRQCLTLLGGDGIRRLDHGLNAVEEDDLLDLVKKNRVGLTGCSWGVYAYLFHEGDAGEKKLFQGMFRKLFDEGVLLTINSDDSAYMGDKWLLDNLSLVVEKCKFTAEEVVRLQKNAVEISWAPKEVKNKILAELDSALKTRLAA